MALAPNKTTAPEGWALTRGELFAWTVVLLLGAAGTLPGRFERDSHGAEVVDVRVERPTASARGVSASPSLARINLNRASAEELELLPGIGPAKARKIVERREAKGPYRSADDLSEIRGISKAMAERIEPLVSVD